MVKNILKYMSGGIASTILYLTPIQADNICIAGNFDGNINKTKQVIQTCKNKAADAIILMGDYSVRGVPGKRNFQTDFTSTYAVLNEFGKSELPVYVLSGSNDKMSEVEQIANKNSNMTFLRDNITIKIGDLNVTPLNGYDNKRFMFEGAKFVNKNDLEQYLTVLSQNPNSVSLSHISPYGHIDRISSGVNVGNKKLEKTLNSLNMNSISAAIRESPGVEIINKTRCEFNPGEFVLMLKTDGNGNIEKFNFYK